MERSGVSSTRRLSNIKPEALGKQNYTVGDALERNKSHKKLGKENQERAIFNPYCEKKSVLPTNGSQMGRQATR